MKSEKIEGLIAAPFTPMKEDGELNFSVVEIHALQKDLEAIDFFEIKNHPDHLKLKNQSL